MRINRHVNRILGEEIDSVMRRFHIYKNPDVGRLLICERQFENILVGSVARPIYVPIAYQLFVNMTSLLGMFPILVLHFLTRNGTILCLVTGR